MMKLHLATGLAAAALMTTAAFAQTSPTPGATASGPGGGQFMTQMSADLVRGSKLMGVDVYGSDNQKIGDVDEVLLDKQGKVNAIVVGIGGFLGIGQKDVAIPYDQVQWMSGDDARTASNTQSPGANTAGGVTTPATPSGTASTGQPATTGSTGAGGTTAGGAGAGSANTNDGTPARAMVRMSKADLQNAPEFRYSANTGGGGAGGTNPPASGTRPGTAPQQ